ncbi:insulinoma-associated protein 2 [Protopterus annectens]|uniref:insulinoma-associated protein 2 n=1 Tax=Protopterus annectens TaxID=7888 RepID=UPI001CFBB1D1|nr:insulinoma-associated protein 2 [Protopterus annectens]
MPRGFLVKRNKRTFSVSYRMRSEEREESAHLKPLSRLSVTHASILPQVTPVYFEKTSSDHILKGDEDFKQPCTSNNSKTANELNEPRSDSSHPICNSVQNIPTWASTAEVPVKPTTLEMKTAFFDRAMSSPVYAESFPAAARFSPIEKLLMHHPPLATPEVKIDTRAPLCSSLQVTKRSFIEPTDRRGKLTAKKSKVMRKLNFEDQVTTSPVLGLKIKEDADIKNSAPSGSRTTLREFICQLCKEEYPDPFALAQHKCSRIVRVEYRCPECDKVFSCPANLASHRRWHKPRPLSITDSETCKKLQLPVTEGSLSVEEGKENTAKSVLKDQHRQTADSSHLDQHLRMKNSSLSLNEKKLNDTNQNASGGVTDTLSAHTHIPYRNDEVYTCPYCYKKFRRQAYLRKHLTTHQVSRPPPIFNQLETGQVTFPCHMCGTYFPTADIRDKHRLWHTMTEEMLLSPKEGFAVALHDSTEGEQQIFSCRHCASTFFSSTGLTRHINKCHPAETRQVLLLQMPLRPGC